MAVVEITNTNALTQEFTKAMRDAGDGSGGTPYMDLREFAARMFDHPQIATGTIAASTNTDGNALEVTLGFQPRAVWAWNVTTTIVYLKTTDMATTQAANVTSGASVATAIAFVDDSGATFGTTANPELGGFTLKDAINNTSDIWFYVALG